MGRQRCQMKIDLHIHSSGSDGKFTIDQILEEAKVRKIGFFSITDHDCISCQNRAATIAEDAGVRYVCGVELNVTFSHHKYREGKPISLDFLGYGFNPEDLALNRKLDLIARFRTERAEKILDNLNTEFEKEGIEKLSKSDLNEVEASIDGVVGRPHIADYLVKKRIVKNRQEAFDRYLVKCDVPKYPLSLEDASRLVHEAHGRLVLAHPNDPNGTSLSSLTSSMSEQLAIIDETMLPLIDGIECWHSRNTTETTRCYVAFAKDKGLLMTGGSDCHQKPILMGTVDVPDFVANQF
jgi:predicted metal-dependent phosphoesterase TrpH